MFVPLFYMSFIEYYLLWLKMSLKDNLSNILIFVEELSHFG